jgi:hypothetical protein
VEEEGEDPQAVEFPNAKPAITHGVVSELTWILLPGGCVIASVALEEAAAAPPPDGVPDDGDPDEPPGLGDELEPLAIEDVIEVEANPEKAEATSEDDK